VATRLTFDERREAILRAALRVIARDGFGAVTTREVTNEAGVTHGLLHHYFPSRDGLLAAAFDLAATEDLARLEARLAKGKDSLDRLRRFVRFYGPTSDDPLVALWIDAFSESTRNDTLRRTAARLNQAWVDLLAGVIRGGAADAMFEVDDPDEAAMVVTAMLDGLAMQMAVRPATSLARMRRISRREIERQLGLPGGALGNR
jgi:AcrR family transcriptional regulator